MTSCRPASKPIAGETGAPLKLLARGRGRAGINPKPKIEGGGGLPGKANYFVGNDPKKLADLPGAAVSYEALLTR